MSRSLCPYILTLFLLLPSSALPAQFWYLDIASGELKCFREGGERFAESGLLAIAYGNTQDLTEQLPHALDAYGIDYDYQEGGILVYTAKVYKAWRLMQAGKDIQAVLGTVLLADLFTNIQAAQVRVVGNLFRSGFPRLGAGNSSRLWELPAVHRGVEIEAIRAGNYRLPHGFPVVDILKNGTATSVKSIDITLPSLQGRQLLYRLKGYVNKLINFRGAVRGGRVVPGNVKKELEVIIPRGTATDAQQKIFEEVIDYGKLNNIIVKFIEL
ncbi:MAG: hypothetical protein H6560_25480 [Lewinellaceae bacterium]|nr:hypothetical protein [Lewinellaceae bacterium]